MKLENEKTDYKLMSDNLLISKNKELTAENNALKESLIKMREDFSNLSNQIEMQHYITRVNILLKVLELKDSFDKSFIDKVVKETEELVFIKDSDEERSVHSDSDKED